MAAITADSAQSQFMQLLVTQLQNQDPMEPVGQQEFITQLSQFSMLEGIEQLNTSFSSMMKLQQLSQGAQLTGRTVEYVDEAGERHQGVVEAASVKDGALQLRIDDKDISVDAITSVIDPLT